MKTTNMKIKIEHYQHMADAIYVLPNLQTTWKQYQENNLSGKRFRWDCMKAAKLTPFLCDVLYNYMHDGHVDTALRHILPETTV